MSTTTKRPPKKCEACFQELPSGAHPRKKYCDRRCLDRAAKQRQRGASGPKTEVHRLRQLLVSAERESARRETLLASARERYADSQKENEKLRTQLRRTKRDAEEVVISQANQTVAVRRQLAAMSAKALDLKPSSTANTNVSQDDAELWQRQIDQLRGRLKAGNSAYSELNQRYKTLQVAAESAASERAQVKDMVRQWDALCRRLNAQVHGRPKTDQDRTILATWSQFRKALKENK